MTKYLGGKFAMPLRPKKEHARVSEREFADNWDRTFGKPEGGDVFAEELRAELTGRGVSEGVIAFLADPPSDAEWEAAEKALAKPVELLAVTSRVCHCGCGKKALDARDGPRGIEATCTNCGMQYVALGATLAGETPAEEGPSRDASGQ